MPGPLEACVGGRICVLSGSIKSLPTAHQAAQETAVFHPAAKSLL
jgi:hypothetical protein